MSTIAQTFPARVQSDGRVWYRTNNGGTDGWTVNIEYADASYRAPDAPAPIPIGELVTWVGEGDIKTPTAARPEPDVPMCPYGDHTLEVCGGGNAVDHGACPQDIEGHVCCDCDPLIKTVSVNLTGDVHRVVTTEEEPLTEINDDGTADTYRRSEICGFPLPPFPEQINVDTDGWNRYKLPSPTTGKLTAFTRATTVAGTTPDDYNLVQWKIRTKVEMVLAAQKACLLYEDAEEAGQEVDEITAMRALAYYAYLKAVEGGKGREINMAIDHIHDICGGAESREHGGAVHDWIAEVDMSKVLVWQVPEQYQVHVNAYQEAMARAGLVAIPEFTERLVLNDTGVETIAGRLDGICYCVETGELHVLDRKTSKTLDFSALEYGIQVAGVYATSKLMLKMDRSGWDPMPELNQEIAFILHIPSDQPERSQVVPIAIPPGRYALDTALQVRAERRAADKVFFGQSYPIPSEASLRYVAARQRLQNLQGADDATAIMQEYADVWTDDLTEFGAWCFELLTHE